MKELFKFERNKKDILEDIACGTPYKDDVSEEEAIARRFMYRTFRYISEKALDCLDDNDYFKCISTLTTLLSEGGGTCRVELHGKTGSFADLKVEGSKITYRILISK